MPAMDYARIADLYDSYVQVTDDISFFVSYVQNGITVLDLMSGTGRVSVPLAQHGAKVTCVDSSPEMLAYLAQKAYELDLSIDIVYSDIAELSLEETFDLILLPLNSFAEITESEGQELALAAIRRHLTAGGKFICTLHNPFVRLQTVGQGLKLRGKFGEPNRTILLWAEEDYDPATQLVSGMQFVEVYDAAGVLIEKRFVELAFYLHNPISFESMLERAGFSVSTKFGDYQRAPFNPETSPFVIWELESL
ncbi:MAG: class I SAM-dependent methyltransferase [Anaerolineales bacterium]|jgi:SAM-dependent methyltransferase